MADWRSGVAFDAFYSIVRTYHGLTVCLGTQCVTRDTVRTVTRMKHNSSIDLWTIRTETTIENALIRLN
jgi:hypothetical protein